MNLREFLTGKEKEVRRYEAPFEKDPLNKKICQALITDYKYQCRRSQKEISHALQRKTSESLKEFSLSVVDFVKTLKTPMTFHQAKVVLKASKFLTSCVAGRNVYAKRCVVVSDDQHVWAIKTFNEALIALNSKKYDAIKVVSEPGKSKKKKGGKKIIPINKVGNVYDILNDPLDEVDEPTEELLEVKILFTKPDEIVDENEKDIINDFLDNEVNDMKDLVYNIIQSDFAIDIDFIWGPDSLRNGVYLPSFGYIGLPTEQVFKFIHKTPRNRIVLTSLGLYLRSHLSKGLIKVKTVKSFFETAVEFMVGLTEPQLEITYALASGIWVTYNGSLPTLHDLKQRMRILEIMLRLDPVYISYASLFPVMVCAVVEYCRGKTATSDNVTVMRKMTKVFRYIEGTPAIEDIVRKGATLDTDNMSKVKPGADARINFNDGKAYSVRFVRFVDPLEKDPKRSLYLPVEILENLKALRIRIHDKEIDAYVKNLVQKNNNLRICILQTQLMYYEGESMSSNLHSSCIQVESFVDIRGKLFSLTRVEPYETPMIIN